MPLNFEKPRVKKVPIIQKVNEVFLKWLGLIRPATILGVFLMVAIILTFLQIRAISFYIIFGIFIIGYFAERITTIIWRHKIYLKQPKTK